MNTTVTRTHPIVIIAGIAVVIFALVGSAALMGWLPKSQDSAAPPTLAETTATAENSAPVDEAKSEKATEPKPEYKPEKRAEKPKPAAKSEPVRATASQPRAEAAAPAAPVCDNCGVIQSVNAVETEGEGSGLGAVAGGVAGGLLGNMVGKGTGKTVATVAGVAGGAYAGHQVEKTMKKTKHFKITVGMDDGTTRVFTQDTDPGYVIGDKVKIVNGAIVRR